MADEQEGDPFEGMIPMQPMTSEQFEEFKKAHMERHERQQAEAQAFQMEKTNFLGGLTAEQLMTFRKLIVAAGSSETAAAYLAGETAALLKYVHKVDPSTGEDPYAQLLGGGTHQEGN